MKNISLHKPCWNLSTVVFSHGLVPRPLPTREKGRGLGTRLGLHALTQLSYCVNTPSSLKPCKLSSIVFAGKGRGCFTSGEQATRSRTFLLFYEGMGNGRGLGWLPCQQGTPILASVNNKSLCMSHLTS